VSVAVTVVTAEGATRHVPPIVQEEEPFWRFHGPTWQQVVLEWPDDEVGAVAELGTTLVRPASVRLPAVLGECRVDVWPKALYVPALIGGPDAAALAEHRSAAWRRHTNAEGAFIDALSDPQPGSIVDLAGGVPADQDDPDQPPS
jgi:hypothetical protein